MPSAFSTRSLRRDPGGGRLELRELISAPESVDTYDGFGIIGFHGVEMRFYRARVTTPNDDHGIIHFLVEEDSGRSIEKVAFDILDAPFLSPRFDSPLHEMVDHADLTELDKETFARTRGTRIPSELPGMTFWWMR